MNFSFSGFDYKTFIIKNKKVVKIALSAGFGLAFYASNTLPIGWREVTSGFVSAVSFLVLSAFDFWITENPQ